MTEFQQLFVGPKSLHRYRIDEIFTGSDPILFSLSDFVQSALKYKLEIKFQGGLQELLKPIEEIENFIKQQVAIVDERRAWEFDGLDDVRESLAELGGTLLNWDDLERNSDSI